MKNVGNNKKDSLVNNAKFSIFHVCIAIEIKMDLRDISRIQSKLGKIHKMCYHCQWPTNLPH